MVKIFKYRMFLLLYTRKKIKKEKLPWWKRPATKEHINAIKAIFQYLGEQDLKKEEMRKKEMELKILEKKIELEKLRKSKK